METKFYIEYAHSELGLAYSTVSTERLEWYKANQNKPLGDGTTFTIRVIKEIKQ